MTRNKRRILPIAAFLTIIIQVLLALFSWIINTVEPSLPVRSMFCDEGARWLFGGFVTAVASPFLVWMLVCAVAWGVFIRSQLWKNLRFVATHKPLPYRHRHALIISAVMFLFIIIVVALLTLTPHAVLLGVNGDLYPSAFSRGFVPMLAFAVIVVSVTYGLASGTFTNLEGIYYALCYGIRRTAALLLLYILMAQLHGSLLFVFF